MQQQPNLPPISSSTINLDLPINNNINQFRPSPNQQHRNISLPSIPIPIGSIQLPPQQSNIAEAIQSGHLEQLPDAAPFVKKRAGKACEACRTRRVKCQGGVPCEACRSYGLVCNMRLKARPKRAITSPIITLGSGSNGHGGGGDGNGSSSKTISPPLIVPQSEPSPQALVTIQALAMAGHASGLLHVPAEEVRRKIKPMGDLEDAVIAWCIQKSGGDLGLSLHDTPRLSHFKAAALLPSPLREEYETTLINSLTNSEDTISSLDFMDSTRLLSIYRRYRLLPQTMQDDHRALLNACFCLASFYLARTKRGKDGYLHIQENTEDEPREDIIYFRMAMEDLGRWGRASIPCLWALHCLKSYAGSCGGVSESREILSTMTTYLKDLGLHQARTAALYPPEDSVDKLFFSCFYEGTLVAGVADSPAHLQWSEFDIDPLKVTSTSDLRVRVALFESRLLKDIYGEEVDTTTPEYVLSTESRWLPLLKELQRVNTEGMPRVLLAWANIRFNWLYILLRGPCLSHPYLASSSYSVLARAASQILWTYSALATEGRLNPAWSQIRRIVTAGHLVILCHEQGDLHRGETEKLFGILMELLDAHRQTWLEAQHLAMAFSQAASFFGIYVEPKTGSPPGPTDLEMGSYLFGYSLPYWPQWDDPNLLPATTGTEGLPTSAGTSGPTEPPSATDSGSGRLSIDGGRGSVSSMTGGGVMINTSVGAGAVNMEDINPVIMGGGMNGLGGRVY